MENTQSLLRDSFGRQHNYLRISLTEKCNLRCTYCMPAEGVPLTPSKDLMTADELFELASIFTAHGVDKIRLTGGEPLVRKDFLQILQKLATLPVSLTLTTNAVLVDRFIVDFKAAGLRKINVSLDTLDPLRFQKITLKSNFEQVKKNLELLNHEGFDVKINVVLLKGVNDDEIIHFIKWTAEQVYHIRFIEFMPFDGNNWDRSKTVGLKEIQKQISSHFGDDQIVSLPGEANDTSKNFKIKGFTGTYGVISTVTNPFCDSCNRLRLTANGRLRNCLFSEKESDLLAALRSGQPVEPIIEKVIRAKHAVRSGLDSPSAFADPARHSKNRSMIRIGG